MDDRVGARRAEAGEEQADTGAQHTPHLLEHRRPVDLVDVVHGQGGDDHVERAGGGVEELGGAEVERGVSGSLFSGVGRGVLGGVDARDLVAVGAGGGGEHAGEIAPSAADVEDGVAGPGAAECDEAALHVPPAAEEGELGDHLVASNALDGLSLGTGADMQEPFEHRHSSLCGHCHERPGVNRAGGDGRDGSGELGRCARISRPPHQR